MNRESLGFSIIIFALVVSYVIPGIAAGLVTGSRWNGLLVFAGLMLIAALTSFLQLRLQKLSREEGCSLLVLESNSLRRLTL